MLAEVLLEMRGVGDLGWTKYQPLRRNGAAMIVRNAIRQGPKTTMELATLFERDGVKGKLAYNRAYNSAYRLMQRGVLVRDGMNWKLAQ